MSKHEPNTYEPGFYIEMYRVDDDGEHDSFLNGLHSEIVYYKPDGTVEVITGWEPKGGFFGLFGGTMQVFHGERSRTPTRNDPDVGSERMVLPIRFEGNHDKKWAEIAAMAKWAHERFAYDAVRLDRKPGRHYQSSNSWTAASLSILGLNPLDVIPERFIPHLPGIMNDLSHGLSAGESSDEPIAAPPRSTPLSVPRDPNRKPQKPITRGFLDLEEERERQEEERLNNLPVLDRNRRPEPEGGAVETARNDASDDTRPGGSEVVIPAIPENEGLAATSTSLLPNLTPPGQAKAATPTSAGKADKSNARELAAFNDAVTSPATDPIEVLSLSDPRRWNYVQTNQAMQSDAYMTAHHPLTPRIREGVRKRFVELVENPRPKPPGTRPAPSRGLRPRPEAFDPKPAVPVAKDGQPLASAQGSVARALAPVARSKGIRSATKVAQKALNKVTFAPVSPMRGDVFEPLKVDGDFGPKTRARTRDTLNRVGTEPVTTAIRHVTREDEDNPFARINVPL